MSFFDRLFQPPAEVQQRLAGITDINVGQYLLQALVGTHEHPAPQSDFPVITNPELLAQAFGFSSPNLPIGPEATAYHLAQARCQEALVSLASLNGVAPLDGDYAVNRAKIPELEFALHALALPDIPSDY